MTVVLVHGNPETDVIWGPLVERLGRDDVVRLSPPGFGAPLPVDFPATAPAYRDWLVQQVAAMDGPVDLVGHDWGGGHVMGLVMTRPDLVRSWVCDMLGAFDPDYRWHDLAQLWQAPAVGEKVAATMFGGTLVERTAGLAALDIPEPIARSIAAEQGPEMGRAMLALYRSAPNEAMAEAGQALPYAAARPGLAVLATEDSYVGTPEMHRRSAEKAGARVEVLEGLGHWWMVQDPDRGAEALTRFWASLD